MRAVVQVVSSASVEVDGAVVAEIGPGLLVLAAIERGDPPERVRRAAERIASLRVFPDAEGRMNRSLDDVGGEVLAVSQFTLAASLDRGRRPSFERAEEPERARELFDAFCRLLASGGRTVRTGVFGARMRVRLTNEGPVTFVLDGTRDDSSAVEKRGSGGGPDPPARVR